MVNGPRSMVHGLFARGSAPGLDKATASGAMPSPARQLCPANAGAQEQLRHAPGRRDLDQGPTNLTARVSKSPLICDCCTGSPT